MSGRKIDFIWTVGINSLKKCLTITKLYRDAFAINKLVLNTLITLRNKPAPPVPNAFEPTCEFATLNFVNLEKFPSRYEFRYFNSNWIGIFFPTLLSYPTVIWYKKMCRLGESQCYVFTGTRRWYKTKDEPDEKICFIIFCLW